MNLDNLLLDLLEHFERCSGLKINHTSQEPSLPVTVNFPAFYPLCWFLFSGSFLLKSAGTFGEYLPQDFISDLSSIMMNKSESGHFVNLL